MRLVIDTLIALMMVGILAGIILHHRQQQEMLIEYQTAHRELSSIHEAMMYHRALDQDLLNEFGYPEYISPLWFAQGLPMNRLVPLRHPWIDMAPPGDMNDQPPDPVIRQHEQAGYWYNPNRGIIRARVTQQFTEQATLDLYNQVNTTMLIRLPSSTDPSRKPIAQPLLADQISAADKTPKRQTLRDLPAAEPALEPTLEPATPMAQTPSSAQAPTPQRISQRIPQRIPSQFTDEQPMPGSVQTDDMTATGTDLNAKASDTPPATLRRKTLADAVPAAPAN